MRYDIIPLLQCPSCHDPDLEYVTFTERSPEEIGDGVIWCSQCWNWFPIQDGLLDFLTGSLMYADDRQKIWLSYSDRMLKIGLNQQSGIDAGRKELQSIQQEHFDWYARNSVQTYREYQQQPFWLAADRLVFQTWHKLINPGSLLLDVGCAEGRSTFQFMDLEITIIGFDVSKALVRQAIDRYRAGSYKATATFLAADASKFPFKNSSSDYVLVYGVLHHLPDPTSACKEIARVLKPSGQYFGSENNRTAFRPLFDFLQRLNPLWHEEAGPEALISRDTMHKAFNDTGVELETYTSVFLPPHFINLLAQKNADRLLSITDRIARAIPVLRDQGGLIVMNATKSKVESNEFF